MIMPVPKPKLIGVPASQLPPIVGELIFLKPPTKEELENMLGYILEEDDDEDDYQSMQ